MPYISRAFKEALLSHYLESKELQRVPLGKYTTTGIPWPKNTVYDPIMKEAGFENLMISQR